MRGGGKERSWEDGKVGRWEKSRTEAFDCGLWIAECGIKKGGKCMEGGMRNLLIAACPGLPSGL